MPPAKLRNFLGMEEGHTWQPYIAQTPRQNLGLALESNNLIVLKKSLSLNLLENKFQTKLIGFNFSEGKDGKGSGVGLYSSYIGHLPC